MKTIGSEIRRRRRQLGLSIEDLANKSGVSKSYLSLIENGQTANAPSQQKIERIESALKLPGELESLRLLSRTPPAVRAVLKRLAARPGSTSDEASDAQVASLLAALSSTVTDTVDDLALRIKNLEAHNRRLVEQLKSVASFAEKAVSSTHRMTIAA